MKTIEYNKSLKVMEGYEDFESLERTNFFNYFFIYLNYKMF